jgi:hypothetical protein
MGQAARRTRRAKISIRAARLASILNIRVRWSTIRIITPMSTLESQTSSERRRRGSHVHGQGLAFDGVLRGVAVSGSRFRREARVLDAESFSFGGGLCDDGWVDYHAAMLGGFGWDALGGE